ncbi:MAG: hypothetical protein CMB97_00240 [Flavobacteriaceae bacterium]|nr:hypothetical protein [Flavobacteriaceae bacterium]
MIASYFPEQHTLERLRNQPNSLQGDIEWPNVVVEATYKKFQKYVPESAFSIFSNNKGKSRMNVHQRTLNVCEQTFYITNPFESFEFEINSNEPVNTFNIHLNYNFFSEALSALLNSNEILLENPDSTHIGYRFTNQLHFKSNALKRLFNTYNPEDEEVFLIKLLEHCLQLDQQEKNRVRQIPAAKKSTQKELLKRMQLAKDYIYSNYSNAEFNIKELSKLTHLSHFHFLRTFSQVFGITPYQYIKAIRIERAKYLIKTTNWPIQDIAFAVGFKEASAIYPIFKGRMQKTPQNYRQENSNSQ